MERVREGEEEGRGKKGGRDQIHSCHQNVDQWTRCMVVCAVCVSVALFLNYSLESNELEYKETWQ